MPYALWLLFRLRFVGWFRRLGRNFQTTKGALLAIFTLMFFVVWLGGVCVGTTMSTQGGGATQETLDKVNEFAPFALLAYCLLVVLTSGGTSPILFSPAEVQFLFSAPFTRRQLLTYKLFNQFLLSVPICFFMTFGLRRLSGSTPQAFVTAFLVFTFLQLFAVAVNFVSATIGEIAYSRARKLILIVATLAIAWAAGQALRFEGPPGDLMETLHRVEQSQVVQWIVTPFRWYVHILTAPQFWPDFIQWTGICLAINLSLVALIYVLDASFLESAAAASERRYAKLQRMRSSGTLGGASVKSGKVRFGLPMLPWLGGAGPIAWRQLTAATRGYRALTIFLIAGASGGIGPIIASTSNAEAAEALPWMLATMGLFMSMLLGQFFAYDFRADVDRIEVLKILPLSPWKIVAGQLVTPVLFSSAFQILLVGLIFAIFGKVGYLLLGTVLFAPPINLILTGVENGIFLLFPTRLVQTNPGDFSQAGRQMLIMLTKMLTLGIGAGVPALVGLGAYWLFGESWIAAGISAWLVAVVLSALPLPLVAMAFRNFDVARDTPA